MTSAVILLSGLPFVVLLWSRPKILVTIGLFVTVFSRTAVNLTGLPELQLADDALVLAVALRALLFRFERDTRRRFPGMVFFLAFAVAGLASGIAMGVPWGVLLSGTFLATKGVAFGWAVAQFDWLWDDFDRIYRVVKWTLVPILLSGLVNLWFPIEWSAVFSSSGLPFERFGLTSVSGIFPHPFDFAFICGMAAIAIMSAREARIDSNLSARLLFVFSLVGMILAARKKDVVGFMTVFVLARLRDGRMGFIVPGSLVTIGVILLGLQTLTSEVTDFADSYFGSGSTQARTVLTLASIRVAMEHFPGGAGFGRFGSRTAAVEYSPEYIRLGLDRVYGLAPGDGGGFLTDTSWPAILGEAGFIGAVLFAGGLFMMFRYALRQTARETLGKRRALATTAIGWMTFVLIDSLGAAVFTAPPMYPFIFGVVGMLVALAGVPSHDDLCLGDEGFRSQASAKGVSVSAPAENFIRGYASGSSIALPLGGKGALR